MIRLTIVFAAAALLLTACASDTTESAAASGGSGRSGAGGTSYAGLVGGGGRGAPGTQEDLTGSAGDRIYFETDQSLVSGQGTETLDKQVQWLRQNPRIGIWVAGNCDERGTEEYNLALGQRRSNADRDYLVSRGIEPGRIQTISYGKSRPVDPASTEEAWARNRNAITSVR